jgi:hypothetical protein
VYIYVCGSELAVGVAQWNRSLLSSYICCIGGWFYRIEGEAVKVIRPWLELDVLLPFSTERGTSMSVQTQTNSVHNKSVVSAHSISYYNIYALYSDSKGF